ncbi:hypothetical protein EVAR_25128_1 [Eumeta japonica]|uniref:Uncharacterized protein n=1 Tax=Eumeta variegata TaxID=151549 RepID=A0A4C1XNZ4_EUMVA|nr:hypothetical protein EVAR_25128_1 [Eumeta japonica]
MRFLSLGQPEMYHLHFNNVKSLAYSTTGPSGKLRRKEKEASTGTTLQIYEVGLAFGRRAGVHSAGRGAIDAGRSGATPRRAARPLLSHAGQFLV